MDDAPAKIAVGELLIDTEHRRVTIGENAVTLTESEYDILVLLANANGKVVTREQAMMYLYGNRDSRPAAQMIDKYVCIIRKKMCQFSDRTYVETIFGRGYRLPRWT